MANLGNADALELRPQVVQSYFGGFGLGVALVLVTRCCSSRRGWLVATAGEGALLSRRLLRRAVAAGAALARVVGLRGAIFVVALIVQK